MSKQKVEQLVRHALWNIYGNSCFYCNKPLDWNELNIDHIIPEHLESDLNKLNEIITDYGLSQSFSINGLSNLVPTHSKCNNRKSGQLFSKSATTFYLELTAEREQVLIKEIDKLKDRRNKGNLMAKLQIAIEIGLITTGELSSIVKAAKESDFTSKEIKLSSGFEFVDAVYDSFYINGDYRHLYDKEVLTGGVSVINDVGEERTVSTLREWQETTESGFYPKTNTDIKLSSNFTDLAGFLEVLSKAKPPKYSFVSEPWISVSDINKLSPLILQDFEGELKEYIDKGISVGDLVRQGIVTLNNSATYQISLEFNGFETSVRERFRADFNDDGYEDIFVSGWVRAIGGTLGFGFNSILTRFSEKELIRNIDIYEPKECFNITLWTDYIDDKVIFYFQNDSDVPVMDAVLFVNKPGRSVEELERSKNLMEVVFGTIPPHATLNHRMDYTKEDNDFFGFHLLSGQFTSKSDFHYEIDTMNNVKEISFRSPFD